MDVFVKPHIQVGYATHVLSQTEVIMRYTKYTRDFNLLPRKLPYRKIAFPAIGLLIFSL
jgi:hypothetical protein